MTRPDPERSQPTADEHAQQAVRQQVLEGYAQIARSGQWSGVQASGPCGHADQGGGGCCGPTTVSATQVAQAVGYDAQQLDALPEGANLGLSCGNPTAIAGLRPGQVVLDLGSGAGMDCFLAGPRVGPTGRAIGVDMTPQMLARARANIAEYRARTGLDNVEFRLGEIEHLPVADASVDVVLSNCVINLSPDKPAVWREIVRVLKPGGTVAISDLALLRPLPESVQADVEALVGCVAGAQPLDTIRRQAEQAGLVDVQLVCSPGYVQAMTAWQDPLYQKIQRALPQGTTMADYLTSAQITARKPHASADQRRPCCRP